MSERDADGRAPLPAGETRSTDRPSEASEYVAPRTDAEAGVAEILAAQLKMERVGAHDNFIALGGESLLAAQAAWQIRERFGCEVPLRSILTGTVADIAAQLTAARAT